MKGNQNEKSELRKYIKSIVECKACFLFPTVVTQWKIKLSLAWLGSMSIRPTN